MDIVAHMLWAAAGATVIHRRRPLTRSAVLVTLMRAALPDVIHLLPIASWWLFADGSFAALRGYAVAVPGQEPALPPLVGLLSHHLHCVMHSAPIAALVTGAVWAARRAFWIPVQRPDLQAVIAKDIAALTTLVALGERLFPSMRALDLPVVVKEFSCSLSREMTSHSVSGASRPDLRATAHAVSRSSLHQLTPRAHSGAHAGSTSSTSIFSPKNGWPVQGGADVRGGADPPWALETGEH